MVQGGLANSNSRYAAETGNEYWLFWPTCPQGLTLWVIVQNTADLIENMN